MPLEYALQHRAIFPEALPWKFQKAKLVTPRAKLGIDALPQQAIERFKRKPFELNLMVAGETGLGKTTFCSTLFNANLREYKTPRTPLQTKSVSVTSKHYELVEGGVTLRLSVIDTPGFGDRENRSDDIKPLLEYIEGQYDLFQNLENDTHVRRITTDSRVHVCLYFLTPSGKRMKELDVKAMQSLAAETNLIPIIAKADTLTGEELAVFKKLILEDLKLHEIPTYPTSFVHGSDWEYIAQFAERIPFAVIGSETFVDGSGGHKVRGRAYRWGTAEVENVAHCDFVPLRELLLVNSLLDLVETTHRYHYANFRARGLRARGRPNSLLACDDAYEARVEDTREIMQEEMNKKEESMREEFLTKVREKETELREKENALQAKRVEMEAEIENERRKLDAEMAELDAALEQRRVPSAKGSRFSKK